MAALTGARDTVEMANGAPVIAVPVKAKTIIYQGSLAAVDADGYAVPAQALEGLKAAGRAEETADNLSGADGEVSVCIRRGCFIWNNSGTEADKVRRSDLFKNCYMADDQTVTAEADGSSVAGRVLGVTDHGVMVETW